MKLVWTKDLPLVNELDLSMVMQLEQWLDQHWVMLMAMKKVQMKVLDLVRQLDSLMALHLEQWLEQN